MKICIDPGHGQHDPGAVGPGGTKEKDVTLSVALKLGEKLKYNGFDIVYTRTNDNPGFPKEQRQNLAQRVSIANTSRADCFISIHCNSATSRTAHGTETYCVQLGYGAEKLARVIQKEIITATGLADRGVKTANFYVLKYTQMPATLIETAFISNPNEERLLKDPEFQNKVATAIAKGVCKFAGIKWEESNMEETQEVSTWAKEAWEWAKKKGITDGTRPKDTATREEIVTMLYRMNGGK